MAGAGEQDGPGDQRGGVEFAQQGLGPVQQAAGVIEPANQGFSGPCPGLCLLRGQIGAAQPGADQAAGLGRRRLDAVLPQ